jgi:hypothetical protein
LLLANALFVVATGSEQAGLADFALIGSKPDPVVSDIVVVGGERGGAGCGFLHRDVLPLVG